VSVGQVSEDIVQWLARMNKKRPCRVLALFKSVLCDDSWGEPDVCGIGFTDKRGELGNFTKHCSRKRLLREDGS